jgi:hypothetical protein
LLFEYDKAERILKSNQYEKQDYTLSYAGARNTAQCQ